MSHTAIPPLAIACFRMVILCLCLTAIGHAEDTDKITELENCKIRISYSGYMCVMGGVKIDNFYPYATEEIIYSNASTRIKKWKLLLDSLNGYTDGGDSPLDAKWAILITNAKGKNVLICYMDAWCKEGWINGKLVKFNGKLGLWLRQHLTEAFDLKDDPIWSKGAE